MTKAQRHAPPIAAAAPDLSGLAALPDGIALAEFRYRILAALRGNRPAPAAPPSPEPLIFAPPKFTEQDVARLKALHLAAPAEIHLNQAELNLLRRLAAARYGAYHTRTGGGFTIGGGGGPQVDGEILERFRQIGFAYVDETGGNHGSTKISAAGRDYLRGLKSAVAS